MNPTTGDSVPNPGKANILDSLDPGTRYNVDELTDAAQQRIRVAIDNNLESIPQAISIFDDRSTGHWWVLVAVCGDHDDVAPIFGEDT